jgi:1,4-dihydroxy-2-naphthoyl-CoA hydrolase
VSVDLCAELNQHLRKGFVELLGLEYTAVSGDAVRAECTVRPELLQPYGILHGGVHCAVVETLASTGAAVWLGERGQVVGVSNSTDFLRAVRAGVLAAVATPVHRGRLQQLWEVRITDVDDRLLAKGQVRLQNILDAERLGH